MIDPTNITKFDRTEAELEEFLLFCVLVAGKDSKVQASKLDHFLDMPHSNVMHNATASPFEKIKILIALQGLYARMYLVKFGQYSRLEKCFTQLMSLQGKLSTCTIDDLEAIYGIANKTSRFFLTHTRPKQQLAILDTHMLHYLRDMGYDKVPSATPTGKKYRMWELIVLDKALSHGMTPADFDLMIWNKYSKNGNNHLDK